LGLLGYYSLSDLFNDIMYETEGFPPKADQVSGVSNRTCQIPSIPLA
jgi:hypothetical protein